MEAILKTLRYLYLVAIAASMPAGFWYLRSHYADTVHLPDLLFFILTYLAGTAFVVFYVFLTQIHFPDKLPGALFSLGLFTANGLTGITLAEFDIFYGAFSVVVTNLFAICAYIVYYLALYGKQATRSELFFVMSEKSTFGFFSGLLICFGLILWAFSGPVVAEILEPKPLYLKILYVAVFGTDIFFTSRAYIRWNMLLARHQTSVQAEIIEEHAIPIGIAMVLSILACLPIVGGFSSARPDPLEKYTAAEYRAEFSRLLGNADSPVPAIFAPLNKGADCSEVSRIFRLDCGKKRSWRNSTDFNKDTFRTLQQLDFAIYSFGLRTAVIHFRKQPDTGLFMRLLYETAVAKWGVPEKKCETPKHTKLPDACWQVGAHKIRLDWNIGWKSREDDHSLSFSY